MYKERLVIVTVNGESRLLKVKPDSQGRIRIPYDEIRRVWGLSKTASIILGKRCRSIYGSIY